MPGNYLVTVQLATSRVEHSSTELVSSFNFCVKIATIFRGCIQKCYVSYKCENSTPWQWQFRNTVRKVFPIGPLASGLPVVGSSRHTCTFLCHVTLWTTVSYQLYWFILGPVLHTVVCTAPFDLLYRSWLRNHDKSRTVVVSIPDDITDFIFNLLNLSSRTMGPGFNSAPNTNEYLESSWGCGKGKTRGSVWLTTSQDRLLWANCLENADSRHSTPLQTCMTWYRDSFTYLPTHSL
jgi:hypothetical protein